MTVFSGAVYAPPGPDMPYVAVIVSEGEVKAAFSVVSIQDGEEKVSEYLRGLKDLAEQDEMRSS